MSTCPYCDGSGQTLVGDGALRFLRRCPQAACRERAAERALAAWDQAPNPNERKAPTPLTRPGARHHEEDPHGAHAA